MTKFNWKKIVVVIGGMVWLGLWSHVSVHAEVLRGVVTDEHQTPESQSLVVAWIEGLEPGEPVEERAEISQSGLQFHPRVLTVTVGQTVDFPNADDVAHNVFSMSKAKRFKLGIYPKGESREVTFEKPGVIDLFCSIHRHMHAVIVVTPSEHRTISRLGETWEITNVPPGSHTLKVWNPAHRLIERAVTLVEGKASEVTLAMERL